MLKNLKLKNPPIKEALISIAFSHPFGIQLNDLSIFSDAIINEYPNKKTQSELTVKINSDIPEKTTEVKGYMLSSVDIKQHIKVNFDSISFHRVAPYDSWEHLIKETKIYWEKFYMQFPDIQINQISVRYINVMNIQFKEEEGFESYLNLLPRIPDNLPKIVEGYFLQLKIPNPIKNLYSVVTEFFTLNQDIVEITLDVNVMKNLDALPCDDTNLWMLFEDLRVFKNDIFFNSITEKTKNLYNA